MPKYNLVNILDLINNSSIGEDKLKTILAEFSCRNNGIEKFIHENAIEFAKKKTSITYLIINDNVDIEAIFTLTHKSFELTADNFSNTTKRKIEKYAQLDTGTNGYHISAFLIAQFGKNNSFTTTITGNEIMDIVLAKLRKIQTEIGGGLVLLECEKTKKLIDFYCNENNNFKEYGERYSEKENIKYKQLFRIL